MDVNGIGDAGRIFQTPERRSGRPESSKDGMDKVEISEQARAANYVRGLAKEVLRLPEVRAEKIREAEELIRSGQLFTEGGARETARAILDMFRT